MSSLSIVMPAKNEAGAIGAAVAGARNAYPDAEIIVVDDGSTDDTAEVASEAGAEIVQHPVSLGNGAAIKAGARAASGDIIAFMDGDGQHDAAEFGPLLKRLDEGFDMAIGARDSGSHLWVSRCTRRFFQKVSVSAAERLLLPDDHHHGVPAFGIPDML